MSARSVASSEVIDSKVICFCPRHWGATLQTAWDAAKAGIVLPILVGEPDIIASDAAAIGWDLSDVEIIPATGEREAIDEAIALFAAGRVAGLPRASCIQMYLWVVLLDAQLAFEPAIGYCIFSRCCLLLEVDRY